MRKLKSAAVLTAGTLLAAAPPSVVHATGATWQATSVVTNGCAHRDIRIASSLHGLTPDSSVIGHSVVRSAGLVYQNAAFETDRNGSVDIWLGGFFNYGPVAKRGTWPIPADQPLRLELSIEHPKGTTLSSWTLSLDSCNHGDILYNGPAEEDTDHDNVPATEDRCPSVDGTGFANGCPLYGRALTVSYHSDRFEGRLATTDPGRELRKDLPVSVWQVRTGSDRLVGKDVTDSNGAYTLAGHVNPGLYYANTPDTLVPTVGAVLAETSERVRVP